MIEDPQRAFPSWRDCGVIEGRSAVEADQRGAIDGAGDDMAGAAAQNSEHQQNHEAGNAEEKADSVSDAVDDFFKREARACHVNGYINIVSLCVARRK